MRTTGDWLWRGPDYAPCREGEVTQENKGPRSCHRVGQPLQSWPRSALLTARASDARHTGQRGLGAWATGF